MLKNYYDIDYKESNREKVLKPKRGWKYCIGCDRVLIGEWTKCPICNTRNGRKRLKK